MASQTPYLHFILFPLMAQGHMIPMMDIAKMLLQRNVTVTVVTTPYNASRFASTFARYSESGFPIRVAQVQFPYREAGVPEGCENLDMLTSLGGTTLSFLEAASFLRQPVEKLFEELTPPPSCIISDMCLPYTIHISNKFKIPRISFIGMSCFCLLCLHNLRIDNVFESTLDETEYSVLPGIPDKIEMTKAQVMLPGNDEGWRKFDEEVLAAEKASYGIIMNSFEELEPAYAQEYKKVKNDKVWCIGPVSLSTKDHLDKAQRGNNASIDELWHLKWLDCQKPGTVIYVCFGSLSNLTALQLIELGSALEASKRHFIWVIREGSQLEAFENWIKEDGFEERTNDQGLIIQGWAPQLLILSHPAIGGFMTHCGWNSTLEALCAGVPMITWPQFGDQFYNEKLVVQILEVGVKVGVESSIVIWGKEEKSGLLVKKEDVERAIEELMGETAESEERRGRIKEVAEKAKKAVEEGGSSHSNVLQLIQDIGSGSVLRHNTRLDNMCFV